jgi:hypothetical protein
MRSSGGEREKEMFYLMTLTIAKIIWRRRQMNEICVWSTGRKILTGENEGTLEENLSHCYFGHHKQRTD